MAKTICWLLAETLHYIITSTMPHTHTRTHTSAASCLPLPAAFHPLLLLSEKSLIRRFICCDAATCPPSPLYSLAPPPQFSLSCMLTISNLFRSCHCRRKGNSGRSSSNRKSRRTRRRQVMELHLLSSPLPSCATVLHREFGARHCIFTFP